MSDETPEKDAAPGSTAADTSTASGTSRPSKSKSSAQKPKSSVAAAVKRPSATVSTKPVDGKGTERGTPKTPKERPHKPVVKVDPGKVNNNAEPLKSVTAEKAGDGAPPARPITAGEYARSDSPAAATAVLPVVKDAPQPLPVQETTAAPSGRQASLKLVRVDPWSVTKVVFALTVALMIVAVVAMTILWIVLSFAGVWDQINSSVTSVLSDDSGSFDITEYLGFGRIVGLTLVISAINVVIMTAVATIGAYLYNLAAELLGGVDVTFAEED